MKIWRAAEWDTVAEFLLVHGDRLSVIDLGCGDGRHLRTLPGIQSGLGVDIDPNAIAIAKQSCTEGSPDRGLTFRVDDFDSLGSLGNGMTQVYHAKVDVAFCLWSTILAASDPVRVWNQMKSLVKPGGSVMACVYGAASVPWRIDWYEQAGEGRCLRTSPRIEMESGFVSGYHTPETARDLFGATTKVHPFAKGEGLMVTDVVS